MLVSLRLLRNQHLTICISDFIFTFFLLEVEKPKAPLPGTRGDCMTLTSLASPGPAAGAAEQGADHQVGAAAAVRPPSFQEKPGARFRELHLQPEEAAGVRAGGAREAGK